MPRFEDTPQYKRRLKWDPDAQKMMPPSKPPTEKQLQYLRDLCNQRGMPFTPPTSRRAAAKMIDGHLKAKARGKRRRS